MQRITTLALTNPAPFDRREAVVSGVPLPPGLVADASALVLSDQAGQRLVCQADAIARWADGSVKWALLTVPRLAVAAGATREFVLGTGRPSRASAVTVRKTRAGVRVETDCVRFTVAKTGPLVPVLESRVRGRWHRRAVDLDPAMSVERDGTVTDYAAGPAPREIDVELAGALRAVIRVRGTHRAAGGSEFGPYTLRLTATSKSRQVHLTHSFVFDGDPQRDFVRSSGIALRALVGDGRRFAFGGDDGRETRFARQRADFCPDFRHAELLQDSATHWRVRRWVDRDRREVFCAEGLRADGWMELSGQAGRVAVCVREMAENHPKSLAADAATGEMRVGLYPARAERLDLRRYSDLVYPWCYEAPAFIGKEPVPFDPSFGALGIRKTHDVALLLDEPNPSAACHALDEPLLFRWSRRWTARARVVVPAAVELDADWDARARSYVEFLRDEIATCGGTGYLDHADLPLGFDLVEGRWFHDYGGWGYINDEAMPCLGLWHAYLLTGDRDAFRLARAMTRHNADVDSHHLGPHAGRGSRHNVNHWGDQCKEERIAQPIGKRLAFYLTGDRSVLDLVEVVMDGFRRRYCSGPTEMGTSAGVPALVATLLTATETGLEPDDGWLASIADALAASIDEHGCMTDSLLIDATARRARPNPGAQPVSFMMFSCFGGAQAFAELAERLDHDALRDGLVRYARLQTLPFAQRGRLGRRGAFETMPRSQVTFRALDLYAYAWTVSRDPVFVELVREAAASPTVLIEERGETRYGVPDAARRRVPVSAPHAGRPPHARRAIREFYPLFAPESMSQTFRMAVYLHKMHALHVLLNA